MFYISQNPLDYLISRVLAVRNGQLLEYTQRPNHAPTNPRRIPSLPVKLNSHIFSKVTQLTMNSIFHTWDHRAASAENHVFHQGCSQVIVAFLQGSLQHVR